MVIGLVGRSCAGKDEGARYLAGRGLPVIDVDKLGHKALEMNKAALVEAFGQGIISPDGSVDRKTLGPIVFQDASKLEVLNGITHPWMADEVRAFVHSHEDAVINCALLESMGLVELCDDVLLFWAPQEVRAGRAMERDGITMEAFLKRDAAQKKIGSSLLASGRHCILILNDGGREQLYRQLGFYCDILKDRGCVYG